jgi:hypothetical protein
VLQPFLAFVTAQHLRGADIGGKIGQQRVPAAPAANASASNNQERVGLPVTESVPTSVRRYALTTLAGDRGDPRRDRRRVGVVPRPQPSTETLQIVAGPVELLGPCSGILWRGPGLRHCVCLLVPSGACLSPREL